jgi:dienelactone hydrolase
MRVVAPTLLLAAALALTTPTVPVLAGDAASPAARLDPAIFKYDKSLPLDVRIGVRDEFDGYALIEFSYRSPIEGRVPAYLIEPATKPARKSPALIFMHGLPGSRDSMMPLAASYARVGVISICITAPFSRFDLPYRSEQMIPAPRYDDYDRREMIQVAMGLSRAIDWLAADPRIDRERIGFVGFSFGGSVGVLMAAIEPRLRTVALMSPTSGLVTWSRMAHEGHPMRQRFLELPTNVRDHWIASMEPLEPVRWLASAKKIRPMLLQAARRDVNVQAADTAQIVAAARKAATVEWYDLGHVLPEQAAIDHAAFLAARLGFDAKEFVPPPAPRPRKRG